MAGSIFVTEGDVSEFQADAVICPTSTYLEGHGYASAAFSRRFDFFDEEFLAIKEQHPVVNERGQRVRIGSAFWLPLRSVQGRLRGIVLVAVTGGPESIGERARLSITNSIRLARANLRDSHQTNSGERWLIAIPTIGLGFGGYSRELKAATEMMIRAAAESIAEPELINGVTVEIDIAFVAYTLVNYRLLLDARRALQLEPPCPLDTLQSRELVDSIRARRCVLFVGAGLSKGAGLPDWSELLCDLAADLDLDMASLPRDASGQPTLDLCLDLAQWHVDRFGRDKLERYIRELFGAAGTFADSRVRPTLAHYLLSSMPFRLFLTTNYDSLLERALTALRRDPEVVSTPENVVRTGQMERPCVVKLHGDAAQGTPVVLTRDDFDTFFQNHPVTAALLQGLLLNHRFLFVGYDLRDPNTRQVYSGVAHLLSKAGTRAYSVVVRDEDITSAFYEDQWSRQGLMTLRMPGPNRIHKSLLFFDWLARQTCDLTSFLHPDLRSEELPADMKDLETVRMLLHQLSDELVQIVNADRLGVDSPNQTKILAAVLDLMTKLGWKPPRHRIWEKFADVTNDPIEIVYYLRRALELAEGISGLEQIRERIKGLRTDAS